MAVNKKETAGIIIRAAVAMTLFIIAVTNYDYLSSLDPEKILSSFSNTEIIIAVVLGMYIVKALVFVLPASVIYVAVGVILDTWLAVGVNLLGIVLEVMITYCLGRFLGGDYVNRILSKKKAGRKLLEKNYQDKKSVMFFIRLLPVFPIDFVSLFYGAAKSNPLFYFLLSVGGIAPRVILFTIVGDNLFKWIPMEKLIFIAICCIPVGVAVYLVKKFVIEKKHKS